MLHWIESALSPEQQKPFTRLSHHACILAAAGSGKTRTLVHLLAADLAAGIPPSGIIAFTFTEKAGEELLARTYMLTKQYLPNLSLEGMYVGTIHAWCLQYLLAQPDFYSLAAVDELHVDALASRLYDTLHLDKAYGQPYPRAIDRFLADLEIFYNENLTFEQVPSEIKPSIVAFFNILQNNRLVSFGGMVRHAIKHLEQYGPISGLQSLYVDEYQDVNPAQVTLIKAMLPDDGKVVVVGDDLQCIYNWRGSDVKRILEFSNEFENASMFRLSINYRARPDLVKLVNNVAEKVELRDTEKTMESGRESADYRVVHWLSSDSDDEQVASLVDIVERFAAKGVPWNRIAVLLRSVVGWGRPFVDALGAKGIPVQCPILSRGGEFINEFLLPVFDWLRSEHKEPRNEMDEADAEEQANNLWATAERWIQTANAETQFWGGINEWLDAIEEKRNDAYDVRGWLYGFLDRCGIRIAPTDHNLMVGLGIASQIIRSVEEIHRRRLERQQRRTARGVMSEVYFALLRNQNDFGESVPIDTEADGILITTVHQAKGLEWPIVIIPMLSNRRFPVRSRSHNTSFPDEIAGRYGTTLEDERRLFYVAVTRARERLFLLDPVQHRDDARSIFLRELEDTQVINATGVSEIDPTVWQLKKEELERTDPAPLRMALSDLLIYVECPYQYGLRRVVAIQPSIGEELGYGRGLHELIRRRFETIEGWAPEILGQQVNQHVNLPYMSEEGEARSRQAIENRIKKLDELGVFAGQVESELPIEVIMNEGIIHGIIDSIQINTDGSVAVRDWKSNIHDNFVSRYERQLQFYTYALRLRGRKVSVADMVDVTASVEQNRLVVHEVDIRESVIRKLVNTLNESLSGIQKRSFTARPNPVSCACCDVYRICSERYANDST